MFLTVHHQVSPVMPRHSAVVVLALVCLFRTGSRAASVPRDLVYVIDEECDIGTSIGHLAPDAGLNDRYPPEVAGSLRFRFLSPAPSYIGLDESTGWLFVSGRVDRDGICRPEVEICRVQQDVAVQPVQYFSILKVREITATRHQCLMPIHTHTILWLRVEHWAYCRPQLLLAEQAFILW